MTLKGSGKIDTIMSLYHSVDEDFRRIIDDTIENNGYGCCLLRMLKLPKNIDMLTSLAKSLLEKYEPEDNYFNINDNLLNITLEDVLFLAGLPITGKPVTTSQSRDLDAFSRVFSLDDMKQVSMVQLKTIVVMGTDNRERMIVVLLSVVSCFIIPSGDGQYISGAYVQFIEKLEEVNGYAWGAALLAFLYHGLDVWKKSSRKTLNDNLWVILYFFLIRMPKLCDSTGNKIQLENIRAPFLGTIMESVKRISKNHKPKYGDEVDGFLDSVLDREIDWCPYATSMLPTHMQNEQSHGTLLAPLFCMNYLVYHTPHHVAKQFRVFEPYDVSRFVWVKDVTPHKGNNSNNNQDIIEHYKKEYEIWHNAPWAEELMRQQFDPNPDPRRRQRHDPISPLHISEHHDWQFSAITPSSHHS